MPFSPETKARIFIRSARICCLCWKQCGTNIEAAHIIAEADGGSNEDGNAIPLCFDCHQEAGAYDNRHPKGNRFTHVELRERRNQLYKLVESGTLQAQIIASQFQKDLQRNQIAALSAVEVSKILPVPSGPSEEAVSVLAAVLEERSFESLPLKLNLLSTDDKAFILDNLLKSSQETVHMEALMSLLGSQALGYSSILLLEQILRKVTLLGAPKSKARFMEIVPVELLSGVEAGLRSLFFKDVIGIMERDQFSEVNSVTPAVIRVQEAIPRELFSDYAQALFSQSRSTAWQGGPAAKKALRNLPEGLARVALSLLNREVLWSTYSEAIQDFVKRTEKIWDPSQSQMFNDYVYLDRMQFGQKYFSDDSD